MKRFKKPYQIATAGAIAAAGTGAGLAGLLAATLSIIGPDRFQSREKSGLLHPGWFCAGIGLVTGVAFAILYYPPCCRRRSGGNQVYLTFDDGPDPDVTPMILDALAEAGAHATFFVLGENVERYPELCRQIDRRAHTLGIHGYRHDGVTFALPSRLGKALDQTLRGLREAGITRPVSLYRPTYGLRGPGVGPALRRRDLQMVLWTLDSHDYLRRDSNAIIGRVGQLVQPGDIILMHDAGETGHATLKALPSILQEFTRRGWNAESL